MVEVPDPSAQNKASGQPDNRIEWRTVRYRSVVLWLVGIVAVALAIVFRLFPGAWVAVNSLISGSPKNAGSNEAAVQWHARFTNLDGTVRVRKSGGAQWNSATVAMDLEGGDTVQTLGDGMARIAFADGALYVVKPDTLIVIEQNAAKNDPAPRNATVQVTSGVVDLSTSSAGGDSRVLFANAEAQIHRASRAMVSNDPQTNLHQITVSKGVASVARGQEKIELAQYEQATFAGPESSMVKAKVMAPPILLTPANQAPVVLAGGKTAEVEFTWSAVQGADSYRLRVSTSAAFSSILLDRRLQSTSIRIPSFKVGEYYWSVTSIGAAQKESQSSDANQFSVSEQQGQTEILLAVDKLIQHGRVIEIVGRTEPGATVLVNNEPVFNVAPNGNFKHFTAPLPNSGPNQITITAQNSKGKVATLRKTVTIQ